MKTITEEELPNFQDGVPVEFQKVLDETNELQLEAEGTIKETNDILGALELKVDHDLGDIAILEDELDLELQATIVAKQVLDSESNNEREANNEQLRELLRKINTVLNQAVVDFPDFNKGEFYGVSNRNAPEHPRLDISGRLYGEAQVVIDRLLDAGIGVTVTKFILPSSGDEPTREELQKQIRYHNYSYGEKYEFRDLESGIAIELRYNAYKSDYYWSFQRLNGNSSGHKQFVVEDYKTSTPEILVTNNGREHNLTEEYCTANIDNPLYGMSSFADGVHFNNAQVVCEIEKEQGLPGLIDLANRLYVCNWNLAWHQGDKKNKRQLRKIVDPYSNRDLTPREFEQFVESIKAIDPNMIVDLNDKPKG